MKPMPSTLRVCALAVLCLGAVSALEVTGLTLINPSSDVDIMPLVDGSLVNTSVVGTTAFNVRADVDTVGSVKFVLSGAAAHTQIENVTPYALYGDSGGDYKALTLPVGDYLLAVTPYSGGSASGTAGATVSVAFTVSDQSAPPPQTGGITRQVWTGIAGIELSDLTTHVDYPANPDSSETLTSFEAPVNVMDDYGQRIIGYLVPPQSGSYTFWLACDDNGSLRLSSDDDPAAATEIAFVDGWTTSGQYDKYSSQQSVAIPLQAGQVYFIEALMKEKGGGDNLSVAWQGPGISARSVIAGAYLIPWDGATPPPAPLTLDVLAITLKGTVTNGGSVTADGQVLSVDGSGRWSRQVSMPGEASVDVALRASDADGQSDSRDVVIQEWASTSGVN